MWPDIVKIDDLNHKNLLKKLLNQITNLAWHSIVLGWYQKSVEVQYATINTAFKYWKCVLHQCEFTIVNMQLSF